MVRNASGDPNPLGNNKAKFIESEELGESVWVWDPRNTGGADPQVTFATRSGDWFAQLTIWEEHIVTDAGSFHFSDESKRTASQYLVRLAQQLSESQPTWNSK